MRLVYMLVRLKWLNSDVFFQRCRRSRTIRYSFLGTVVEEPYFLKRNLQLIWSEFVKNYTFLDIDVTSGLPTFCNQHAGLSRRSVTSICWSISSSGIYAMCLDNFFPLSKPTKCVDAPPPAIKLKWILQWSSILPSTNVFNSKATESVRVKIIENSL